MERRRVLRSKVLFLLTSAILAWVIFISILYRSMMMFFAPSIQMDLHLSFRDLGCIGAISPFTFAVMECFLVPLMNRFGAKKILLGAFLFSTLGIIAFGFSYEATHFVCARIFLAVGVSILFPACWTVVRFYGGSPRRSYALYMGLLFLASMAGILAIPFFYQYMRELYWREAALYIAAAFSLSAIGVFCALPSVAPPDGERSVKEYVASLRLVVQSKIFWGLAPLAAISLGLHSAIASTIWIMEIQGLSGEEGAVVTLFATSLLLSLSIVLEPLRKRPRK